MPLFLYDCLMKNTHRPIQNMVVWSQKLVTVIQLSAWMNKRGLSIWFLSFYSVTLSHSFFSPPLLICLATLSPSTQSLFVSQTLFPLTQVHTFLPHLLSISPLVHFLSPALNSSFSPFILSILASFLILPVWFSLFAGRTSLSPFASLSLSPSHLSVYLPPLLTLFFIPLCFCPPSIRQPTIPSFFC